MMLPDSAQGRLFCDAVPFALSNIFCRVSRADLKTFFIYIGHQGPVVQN